MHSRKNAVIHGFFAESGLELRDTELFLRYNVVFEKRSSIQLQNFLITRMYGLELCDSFVKDRNITRKDRVALWKTVLLNVLRIIYRHGPKHAAKKTVKFAKKRSEREG